MRNGKAIIQALGGKRANRRWLFRCPCHDDRKPSASLRDDGKLECFAGCDARAIALALDSQGFKDDGNPGRVVTREEILKLSEQQKLEAQWLWKEWEHDTPRDTITVEYYLRSRGILLPVPPALRRYRLNGWIAAAQSLKGEVICVQYRTPGYKPFMHGVPSRSAIQLAPAGRHLGLAEGLETAMSATQITGVPCWCCMGAKNMAMVDIPGTVEVVHLFYDNDEAGIRARDYATRMYRTRGFQVWQRRLDEQFKDWNDPLKRAMRDAEWWEQWQRTQEIERDRQLVLTT